MKKLTALAVVILLGVTALNAQRRAEPLFVSSKSMWFRPQCGTRSINCTQTRFLGLIAELQSGNEAGFIGASLIVLSPQLPLSYGCNLSVGRLFNEKRFATSIAVWNNLFIGKGFYITSSIKGLRYENAASGIWALRPQAGLGYGKFSLYYGHEFIKGENNLNLVQNTVTAAYTFSRQ